MKNQCGLMGQRDKKVFYFSPSVLFFFFKRPFATIGATLQWGAAGPGKLLGILNHWVNWEEHPVNKQQTQPGLPEGPEAVQPSLSACPLSSLSRLLAWPFL